jgi:hypothetical protein
MPRPPRRCGDGSAPDEASGEVQSVWRAGLMRFRTSAHNLGKRQRLHRNGCGHANASFYFGATAPAAGRRGARSSQWELGAGGGRGQGQLCTGDLKVGRRTWPGCVKSALLQQNATVTEFYDLNTMPNDLWLICHHKSQSDLLPGLT